MKRFIVIPLFLCMTILYCSYKIIKKNINSHSTEIQKEEIQQEEIQQEEIQKEEIQQEEIQQEESTDFELVSNHNPLQFQDFLNVYLYVFLFFFFYIVVTIILLQGYNINKDPSMKKFKRKLNRQERIHVAMTELKFEIFNYIDNYIVQNKLPVGIIVAKENFFVLHLEQDIQSNYLEILKNNLLDKFEGKIKVHKLQYREDPNVEILNVVEFEIFLNDKHGKP